VLDIRCFSTYSFLVSVSPTTSPKSTCGRRVLGRGRPTRRRPDNYISAQHTPRYVHTACNSVCGHPSCPPTTPFSTYPGHFRFGAYITRSTASSARIEELFSPAHPNHRMCAHTHVACLRPHHLRRLVDQRYSWSLTRGCPPEEQTRARPAKRNSYVWWSPVWTNRHSLTSCVRVSVSPGHCLVSTGHLHLQSSGSRPHCHVRTLIEHDSAHARAQRYRSPRAPMGHHEHHGSSGSRDSEWSDVLSIAVVSPTTHTTSPRSGRAAAHAHSEHPSSSRLIRAITAPHLRTLPPTIFAMNLFMACVLRSRAHERKRCRELPLVQQSPS
jgi:hypothetical protein